MSELGKCTIKKDTFIFNTHERNTRIANLRCQMKVQNIKGKKDVFFEFNEPICITYAGFARLTSQVEILLNKWSDLIAQNINIHLTQIVFDCFHNGEAFFVDETAGADLDLSDRIVMYNLKLGTLEAHETRSID